MIQPNDVTEIMSLIQQKAGLEARLRLIPYPGSPEIKTSHNRKYLYVRSRVGSRNTSTYVGPYSDDLYQMLVRDNRECRRLKKELRAIRSRLAILGYQENELSPEIIRNLDFARAHIKESIYDQAVLEGVATTFPQTEDILENRVVSGMKASDIQKILNLKHAWEFILDPDVIQFPSTLSLLSVLAAMINEGFYINGGEIRSVPVSIHGSAYIPPLPIKSVVLESISEIIEAEKPVIEKAIDLLLYCMKTQIFIDGNKRAAVIFANHFLISQASGLLTVPEEKVDRFKTLLIEYYEGRDTESIRSFLKEYCWQTVD